MSNHSIKVTIQGREYPVNVTPENETLMRKAAQTINEQVKQFSSSYAITDPRDLLAMSALQLAFQQLEKDNSIRQQNNYLELVIGNIENLLAKG
jgi:cell division protein ZapA (FtsZ GTPase activity inhibitor)